MKQNIFTGNGIRDWVIYTTMLGYFVGGILVSGQIGRFSISE